MPSRSSPPPGVEERELAEVAQMASLADETPEGRSIVVLAKERFNLREHELLETHARFVPFTAQTRMSGVDLDGIEIRKGAVDAVAAWSGHRAAAPSWPTRSSGSPPPAARRWRWPGIAWRWGSSS